MSMPVFAGASEFAAVGLISGGLAWPGIELLTALAATDAAVVVSVRGRRSCHVGDEWRAIAASRHSSHGDGTSSWGC